MRTPRKNNDTLRWIALGAIALGIVNLVLQRFIDGALCIVAGAVTLAVWQQKRRR